MALRLYIQKNVFLHPSKQEDNITCLQVINASEIAETYYQNTDQKKNQYHAIINK